MKRNQNPSPESSVEDQDFTVTACTRNDASENQTHEDGKDLRRARYSQSGCCQELSTKQPETRRQWRRRRKPNTAEGKETSRAKSTWHEESNQIATVLNSIHQLKIWAHMLNRSRSVPEINKHPVENKYDLRPKPVKTTEAKDFNKSEAETVDVIDTLQHVISIEKEVAKNLTFLQMEIDTRNTNNATVALITYHRADKNHRRFTPETQPPLF